MKIHEQITHPVSTIKHCTKCIWRSK